MIRTTFPWTRVAPFLATATAASLVTACADDQANADGSSTEVAAETHADTATQGATTSPGDTTSGDTANTTQPTTPTTAAETSDAGTTDGTTDSTADTSTSDGADTEADDTGDGCQPHAGDLQLDATADLSEWSKVSQVDGNLVIDFGETNDLSQLECLAVVRGDLVLRRTEGVTDTSSDVSSLGRLTLVDGNFHIEGLQSLEDLSWLEHLGVVEGDFVVDGTAIVDGTLPTKLVNIKGGLRFTDNAALSSIDTSIVGTIEAGVDITANESLEKVHFGDSLAGGMGPLTVKENASLLSITGGKKLFAFDAITLEDNEALRFLSGLENIPMLPEGLTVRNNDKLTKLDDLSSLMGVGANIEIVDNHDLTALWDPAVLIVGGDRVEVSANANLDPCVAEAWAAKIMGMPTIDISDNKDPNCEN